VDPNSGDVISAFYKHHNTLNKMNDNFRLFEYKRKQYMQKKDKSASPKRHNIINASDIGNDYSHPSSPNKNFLTKLPGMSATSEDTVPKDLQPVMEAKLTSSQRNRNSG